MAKAEIEKESSEGVWGTFEELLLACAVNRHGTNSWDSIAKELQKRCLKGRSSETTDKSNTNAFAPQDCQRKYRDLRRRFNVKRCGDALTDGDGDREESVRNESLAMVDELKKLRVEELKREVHRYDVSIVSLQLKVQKLQEERERSVKTEAEKTADLNVGTGEKQTEPEGSRRDKVDGEAALGGGSDEPEDRSFNESNSTNHKGENRGGAEAGEDRESKGEPEENRIREPEPVRVEVKSEPAKNSSFSGGSGDVDGRVVEMESSQPSRLGDAAELRESVSDSKREKHSSDVQSSASLSRRKRRRWRGGGSSGMGGGSSGDDVEAEEQSPAIKRISAKSQPLIRFMEMLRFHKRGSVFERRLPSQKTEKYENLIRQHMDLETVQSKLEKGIYCDCHLRFYRDLLLIFTNAVIFYRKSSAEHLAARELRRLVHQEILRRTRKFKPVVFKPDPPPQLLDPVVKKPRSTTAMIVCRRRNSSSGKPSSLEGINKDKDGEEKKETTRERNQEQPKPELKRALSNVNGHSNNNNGNNGITNKGDQKGLQKKSSTEKLNLGSKSLSTKKSSNFNSNHDRNKKKETRRKNEDTEEESSDSDAKEEDMSKKEKAVLATKKAGVVNFLKRMKQNSPAREATRGNGLGEDERRDKANYDKKKLKKREIATEDEMMRTSGRSVQKEVEMRGFGRPPRRKADVNEVEAIVEKRKREGGEKEASSSSGRLKKKLRR